MSDPAVGSNPAEITLDPVDVIATPNYLPPPIAGGDVLTLTIGNVQWSGWQRVQVTRSLETVPANFDIMLTEKFPNMPDIDIRPGAPCTVALGGDLVLTGFVDRYEAVIDSRTHTVRIAGRSKSADLVDCAAFVGDQYNETYQIAAGTTLSVVRDLAKSYGITVNSLAGDGVQIPPFPINLGETAWEIIDRITRYSQLVAYDLPDGSILLAQAGDEVMSSGFIQGLNVEAAECNFTMDQRFSLYEGFLQSTATLLEDNSGGTSTAPDAVSTDSAVPRFRKKIIISEQTDTDGLLIQKRTQWEAVRRAGRSMAVNVTVDSWRASDGTLWTPNHLAPISIPALKIPNSAWVIANVTYIKDDAGTHAAVLLMPAWAFAPEPMAFYPIPPTEAQIQQGLNPTAPDAAAPPETTAPAP